MEHLDRAVRVAVNMLFSIVVYDSMKILTELCPQSLSGHQIRSSDA